MIELERLAHELTIPKAGQLTRLRRILSLTRHYRWSQLVRRGWNVTRARFAKNASVNPAELPALLEWNSSEQSNRLAEIIVAMHATGAAQLLADLKLGRLSRLNQSHEIGWPVEWRNGRNQSRLWRFQLHYHEFLLPLAGASSSTQTDKGAGSETVSEAGTETDRESAWNMIWSVVESWLDQYSPEKTARADDAWHPYCISRRVQVWVWLLSLGHPSPTLKRRMLISMFRQIEHLHCNLEKDLGGNHLLENLTAIALAAAVVRSPRSDIWLATVERELQQELNYQILPHGEHFELAPMYHCQALSCLLRIGWMCENVAPQLTVSCRNRAVAMLRFLQQTLHPDQEISLLGDSGFGEAPSVREIQQVALLNQLDLDLSTISFAKTLKNHNLEPVPTTHHCCKCGPYWIYRDNAGDFVIFDRGEIAAKGLPAHGHCDLLGFEGSIGGRRWFVDSGNFNYESDSMRSYCRSSLAHNVVTCGERNHADIWSRFRMGDRAKVVDTRNGFREGFQWASARVTGFPGNKHCCWDRLFAISPDQRAWLCADRVSGPAGNGPFCVGYLHLSPELNVLFSQIGSAQENQQIELSDGDTNRRIVFFNCTVQITDGWYCPEFGQRFSNKVLVYRCRDRTSPFGWFISPLELSEISVSPTSESIAWIQLARTFEFDWK